MLFHAFFLEIEIEAFFQKSCVSHPSLLFYLLCKRGQLVKSPLNALCYSNSQKKIENLYAFPCLFFLCVNVFEGLKIFPFCEDMGVSTTVNQRLLLLGSDFLLRFLLVLCTDKCINDYLSVLICLSYLKSQTF